MLGLAGINQAHPRRPPSPHGCPRKRRPI